MFEPKEEIIKSVEWEGESNVLFRFEGGLCWHGAKRKDFWHPDKNWEAVIKKGSIIRLWTIQFSTVMGFELRTDGGEWLPVWCMANDFGTKAERKKSEDAYVNFIKAEGELIAKLIDEGRDLKGINEGISPDHTGNTFGCALAMGIANASDKENADKVRKQHNSEYSDEEREGVINPAVVTVGVKDE